MTQPTATITRAVKRKNPQQFAHLCELCKEFLKAQIPESNIVLESDFAKYIPLFNRESVKGLDEEAIKELATEYRGQFSLQHDIKIVSAETVKEPGEDVALYPGDKQYHKVVLVLPPLFKSLKTLNELGPRVPALIDALMTSSSRKDNFSLGATNYCASIIQAMQMVNPPKDKLEYLERVRKTEEKFNQIKKGIDEDKKESPVGNNSQEDSITTGDDVFEW